jgi:hypothetical protein
VPGRRAAYLSEGDLQPYSFSVPLAIHDVATVAALHDAWDALSAVLAEGELVLARRLTRGSGETTQQCRGIVAGALTPEYLGMRAIKAVVSFMNLDAAWHDTSAASRVGSGTLSVPGNLASTRATITMSGGADHTVSVAETATSMTLSGSTSTEVVVTNEDWSAVQGGTTDVSGRLTGTGARTPLVFAPGTNTLTVTGGGTTTVAVFGAHR